MNVFCRVRSDGYQIHLAGERSGKRESAGAEAATGSITLEAADATAGLPPVRNNVPLERAEFLRKSRRFIALH